SRIPISWTGTARTILEAVWPDADFRYRRGLDFLNSNLYEAASTEFSEAIERNPRHVEAYYHRGLAQVGRGDGEKDNGQKGDYYAAALRDFFKAIELDPLRRAGIETVIINPKFAVGHNSIGVQYFNRRDYGRAIQEFGQAVQLNPAYA